MLNAALLDEARAIGDSLTSLRRAIHAEPELGLHNPLTRDKIRAALADLPLEWREGPSTTGLVATLKGGAAGRSVLLRGDMDALPMPEETGLDFASTIPGRMHACGHDAHVAMLAGAARLLCARRESLAGEVRFMFQPGEEGFHGARFMLEDGLLGGEGTGRALPEAAFALHIMPNAKHGLVAGRSGPLMASADQFEIVVTGRGGHAALPHQALDPVPVACEIVTALQTLIARQFDAHDPVIATVAQIGAGTAHNIIADFATLRGTLRTLSPCNRDKLHAALTRLATGIAAAHGASATVTITPGFPVTNCDPRAVAMGEAVSAVLFGETSFRRLDQPMMGAEDFSYVLEKVPGAMFFLGVAAEGADWHCCPAIHSPRMMVDESALPNGAALLAGCAEKFLAEGWA
jgi:amidohydrolase